jgi:hypothetical protein
MAAAIGSSWLVPEPCETDALKHQTTNLGGSSSNLLSARHRSSCKIKTVFRTANFLRVPFGPGSRRIGARSRAIASDKLRP